ncbi:MAG TPA: T9SS type A sorting domain-containing protein [Saprospiraceae bacterium]|nr:T9SS type A sorting domain-containing protein [Saprospiraceae bacterium]
MKRILLTQWLLLATTIFTLPLFAQNVFEGTQQWHPQDHSAWKIEPQNIQNYVIMGNKFFEPNNNTLYISEFSEFAQFNSWSRAHTATENLQTFWKSFCKSTSPVGYFAVAGTASGNKVYTLTTNATGQKFWERVSNLPFNMQYGGVCQATNGGYIACGSNNSGELAVTKFNGLGEAEWTMDYPVSGFGWCIKQANGGGYVLAGTRSVIRIEVDGSLVWAKTLNLPISPDGSNYSYTEFEEILPLSGENGFILTGSAFSNSHSGAYTARFSWAGTQVWAKINETVNTALPGTPVCWINNAVLSNSGSKVITTWRNGPVSSGGALRAQLVNIADGAQGAVQGLGNAIPVQEAFATRAHGRLVIGGTRGTYSQAYAYSNTQFLIDNALPQSPGAQLDVDNIPNVPTVSGYLTSVRNAFPTYESGKVKFDDPTLTFASRTAYTDLTIFPNPSNGLVYVGGKMEPGAMLRIFDLTGKLIVEKQVPDGESMLNFDLTSQPKGMYSIQMAGTLYNITRKFILE